MHDNTWARALREAGAEVTLIPTYTPIRVDEDNASLGEVFLGGINVYLEYRWPWWQKLPRGLTGWLNARWILNLASRFGISSDAAQLGDLTLALLAGESGPQHKDVDDLVAFLTDQLRPDVICFSNALLVGVLRRLKEQFRGLVYCTLQGDDVFLEALPKDHRRKALAMIHDRAAQFDGFLVHSRYYRDFMADYLGQPSEKFHLLPLGIDLHGHDGEPGLGKEDDVFTVGYFARICPEKGLHRLVEAFRILHRSCPETRLRAGGSLTKQDEAYLRNVRRDAQDLGDAFEYIGSPETHQAKVEFLKSLDVLSVPTAYHEPKGLYVLESLANGVPVVQPRHGAFPELIEATGGGLLVEPDSSADLARALQELQTQPQRRIELGATGQQRVRELFNRTKMAEETLSLFSVQ